jgi:hypothetical protein
MVKLVTRLGRFKAIHVLFGAAALTKNALRATHLLLLTSQRRFSNPV